MSIRSVEGRAVVILPFAWPAGTRKPEVGRPGNPGRHAKGIRGGPLEIQSHTDAVNPGIADWKRAASPLSCPPMSILEEFEWRGLVADCTDAKVLGERLARGPITLYAGFDPSADSLHVGNLVPLFGLRRFQLHGHLIGRA